MRILYISLALIFAVPLCASRKILIRGGNAVARDSSEESDDSSNDSDDVRKILVFEEDYDSSLYRRPGLNYSKAYVSGCRTSVTYIENVPYMDISGSWCVIYLSTDGADLGCDGCWSSCWTPENSSLVDISFCCRSNATQEPICTPELGSGSLSDPKLNGILNYTSAGSSYPAFIVDVTKDSFTGYACTVQPDGSYAESIYVYYRNCSPPEEFYAEALEVLEARGLGSAVAVEIDSTDCNPSCSDSASNGQGSMEPDIVIYLESSSSSSSEESEEEYDYETEFVPGCNRNISYITNLPLMDLTGAWCVIFLSSDGSDLGCDGCWSLCLSPIDSLTLGVDLCCRSKTTGQPYCDASLGSGNFTDPMRDGLLDYRTGPALFPAFIVDLRPNSLTGYTCTQTADGTYTDALYVYYRNCNPSESFLEESLNILEQRGIPSESAKLIKRDSNCDYTYNCPATDDK